VLNVSISDWTKERVVATYGTNYGSSEIPFQGWRHFKEAYTPELVERADACGVVDCVPQSDCIHREEYVSDFVHLYLIVDGGEMPNKRTFGTV